MQKHFIFIICLFVAPLLVLRCAPQPHIQIGFVGGLTGRNSSLGISGRNGVMLAVEEVNGSGGIRGRKVILVTKDDKQDVGEAQKVVNELISSNVDVIIGHMTSQMADATVPLINAANVLMISPTVSTNSLTGIDDNFLRLLPPTAAIINYYAKYSYHVLGVKSAVVIYDTSNESYSKDWFTNFKNKFDEFGLDTVKPFPYDASVNNDFHSMAKAIAAMKPDSVVIASVSIDAALLCQHLRINNFQGKILASSWSMTHDFIEYGGKNVEGVYFMQWFDEKNDDPAFLAFKAKYIERFGIEPDFASTLAYEAAYVVFRALAQTKKTSELKSVILNTARFPGLQGDILFDRFGEPTRQMNIFQVKNSIIEIIRDYEKVS
jgi:branched-chain amino acid transport system substrate-binding protein